MASSSFSSLKDLLNKPNSNPMPTTKPMKPSVSSTTPNELAQKLEKAFDLESNASSSPQSSSSPPYLQFLMSMPSEVDISLNLGKGKEEFENMKHNESHLERNLGEEKEDNENKPLTNRKCYLPPISCLKKVKVGKPYRYLTYGKENDSYVVEEIKIPNRSLFHASREDGRLKLSLNFEDEEEESQES
ncbi:The fantastic four family [Sesbania bispinosa]|nr:The fantastic four family [Sesbania bispinosa]